jgi:D-alanine transaminase
MYYNLLNFYRIKGKKMKKIVYLNGEYIKEDEAKVSIFDRGYLFGDGIYEVVPIVDYTLLDKEPFLHRFNNSLNKLSLKWPMSEDELLIMLEQLIKQNDLKEGGIYIQVTRGVAPRDFAFPKDISTTCTAFVFEKNLIHNDNATNGVKVSIVDDIRWKRRDIKSIALLGQCVAKEQAIQNNAFEGWMVEDGYVTEGTSSSAYIVVDDTIITRPLSNTILPGIRRKLLLEHAKNNNMKIDLRAFTVKEAINASEAFLSSATTFVYPVIQIDEHIIGNGKVGKFTKSLRDIYINEALRVAGIKK